MPHQCVRCNTFYDDGATEILKGCKCGGKLFFYVKKSKIDQAKKASMVNLSKGEQEQIEKDVFELVGSEFDKGEPVVLDFESIRIAKPGQYELDLVSLFKKEPLVFKLEEGKYMIDVAESFKLVKEKK